MSRNIGPITDVIGPNPNVTNVGLGPNPRVTSISSIDSFCLFL